MAALRPHGHIQVLLGDVDADKNFGLHSLLSRPCTCEVMVSGDCSGLGQAGRGAHATGRPLRTKGGPGSHVRNRCPRGRPMGLPLGEKLVDLGHISYPMRNPRGMCRLLCLYTM